MSLPFFNTGMPPGVRHQRTPLDLSLADRRHAVHTPGAAPPTGVLGAVDALAATATAGLFGPPASDSPGPGPSALPRTGPSAAARNGDPARRMDPAVKEARAAERARLAAAAREQAPKKRPRASRMTAERQQARAIAQQNLAQARKAARGDALTSRHRRQIDSGMDRRTFDLHVRSITALNKVDGTGRPLYGNPDGSANLTAHDRDQRAARAARKRLQAEAAAASPAAPADKATRRS